MKTLLLIAVTIAVTLSERCDHDDECVDTACLDPTHSVRCSHDRCTCVSKCASDDSCDSRKECEHDAVKQGCSCSLGMHCIDKRCHCGYPVPSTSMPFVTSTPAASTTTSAATSDGTTDGATDGTSMGV